MKLGLLGVFGKMELEEKEKFLKYILLLRFGCGEPSELKPVLNIQSIAKHLKTTSSQVRVLIEKAISMFEGKDVLTNKKKPKLQPHHIEYLTHRDTLQTWAHLPLSSRAVLFHRQFPEVIVSQSTILRAYKRAGIKFKTLRTAKKEFDLSLPLNKQLFLKMHDQLYRLKNSKMVFLDECIFTFSTLGKRAWSLPYQSIKVSEHNMRINTQALICAISNDRGLEGYLINKRSIKTEQFIKFIQQLSVQQNGQPFAIFMDNLQVHKTNLSRGKMRELNIQSIFNMPYSPQYNPIELFFSQVKAHYKKLLLHALIKGQRNDTIRFIRESLERVPLQVIKNCVRNCIQCIQTQAQALGIHKQL